jgi:hypothetical protein
MNDDLNESLIDGYLDDDLSASDAERFRALLKDSLEFARQFARAVLLHDRLRTEFGLVSASSEMGSGPSVRLAPRPLRRGWVAAAFATAAALITAFVLPHAGSPSSASAASRAIERLIEAARQPVDRVYRIRITDHGPGGPAPQVMSGGGGKKPSVDGAELSIRGADQFVLVRRFGDGTLFVTGSDGELGWAAAPKGPVHLSRDVRRFRRAVPGEHEDIPFLDLETGLETLRRDYDLTLVDDFAANPDSHGWSLLEARKQPRVRRGPELVQIWFDAAGTAHRIAIGGLPQDEPDGAPRAVELELTAERDLGPDFFRHESHHAVDRQIDWE